MLDVMDIRRGAVPQEDPGTWFDGLAGAAGEAAAPGVWRLRIRMADRPGTLARVAIRLADLECNVLGLAVLPVPEGVLDEIVIRPADGLTRDQLVRAIRLEDCECLGITSADVHELVDGTTVSLAAAGRVLADPSAVVAAVRDVLAADMVTVVPADEANPGRSEGGHRAVLAVGDGEALVARRVWAPFVQLELARAEALLNLLATVRANLAGPAVVTCDDGATVVLRNGVPGDADVLAAMHGRCSPDTLFQRYRTGMSAVPRRWLRRLLAPRRGFSVLAVCGRDVIGFGQLIADAGGGTAEVSLLVEDAWQRNGLGAALLGRLAALAAARGYRTLVARRRPERDWAHRIALKAGLRTEPPAAGDTMVRVALPPS